MQRVFAFLLFSALPAAVVSAQVVEPVSVSDEVQTLPSYFDNCHGYDSCGSQSHYNVKHDRVDTHAPAFLMGDHVHEAGEWMVEYKYSNMYMDGNRAGTTRLTDLQALNFIGTVPPGVPGVTAYGATPTSMTIEMHMAHIMRGVTDDVTAYIMPMWMVNTMDHLRRNGTTFRTTNSGFSDLRFGALWRVYNGNSDDLILNIGFSAPTGDIDNRTSIPTGVPTEFPYPMRLGHGTWDALPAITYKAYGVALAWDSKEVSIFRWG